MHQNGPVLIRPGFHCFTEPPHHVWKLVKIFFLRLTETQREKPIYNKRLWFGTLQSLDFCTVVFVLPTFALICRWKLLFLVENENKRRRRKKNRRLLTSLGSDMSCCQCSWCLCPRSFHSRIICGRNTWCFGSCYGRWFCWSLFLLTESVVVSHFYYLFICLFIL